MPVDIGVQQERRAAIREILAGEAVASQRELLVRLRARGLSATQSSISRDLGEMGVARVDGRYRLIEGGEDGEAPAALASVAAFIGEVKSAGPHLLVVGTPPGLAASVALALDQAGWPEVVGTVAGDDTFFIAVTGRGHQRHVEARLAAVRTGGRRA